MKKLASIFAFLAVGGFISNLSAQPANIDLSGGIYYEGEPYLAVNPTNPQNILVAWMGFALNGTYPTVSIKTKATFDGGATWGNLVAHPHFGKTLHSADVSMAFRKDGTVFMSYIDFRETPDTGIIYITHSADGGVTWSNPVQVWDMHEDATKAPIDRPWLVVDNSSTANSGMLYITTKPAPWISPPNRPYLKTSSDSGQTWSAYRFVDSTGNLVGNTIAAPMGAPAVTSDGALCIAYPSYLASQNIYPRLIFAKSYNRALGFDYHDIHAGVLVPLDTNLKGGYRLTTHPANPNIMTFATPANFSSTDPDVYVVTTTDGGATWSSPVKVNDDAFGNGKSQDMVWADYAANGDLLVTWRDRRNASGTGFYGQPYDFYGAVSHDNGATFLPNVILSSMTLPFDSVLANNGNDFMSCALVSDTICAVWSDTRTGKLNIYFVKTADSTGQSSGIVKIAEENLNDFVVFPSPAQNEFTIAFISSNNFPRMELLTETGQLILKKDKITSGEKLDCSKFSNGIYFITLSFGRESMTKKIVIDR